VPIIKDKDFRIAFKQKVELLGKGAMISSTDVTGGVIIKLQVEIYDANDQLLDGVGSGELGPPVTSERGGKASWLFKPHPNTSYIKWGITAFRSAFNLGRYSVTTKVFDFDGKELAVGRFEAEIPEGKINDVLIKDGVEVSVANELVALGEGMEL
jgi:hypothetical protein